MIAHSPTQAEAQTPDAARDASSAPTSTRSANAEDLARRVDEARRDAERLSPEAKATVEKHADALESFLAAAMRTIVRTLKEDSRGKELLFGLVDDPLVYAALLRLGVVKPDITTRVASAVERVRPYARSHGGDVELVRVESGVAFIRLSGACSGCSMSAQTMSESVEKAIQAAAPEIQRVEQVHDRPVAGFVPLSINAAAAPTREKGWAQGPVAGDVSEARPTRMLTDGADVIVVRRGQRLFAYRNACPHMGMALDDAMISDNGTLTCPWHGMEFDICSGECHNEPAVQLDPLPLKVHEGHVWVRLREGTT